MTELEVIEYECEVLMELRKPRTQERIAKVIREEVDAYLSRLFRQ